jgi:hypothetical protein
MLRRRAPFRGSKKYVKAAIAAPNPRSRFMNPLSVRSNAGTPFAGQPNGAGVKPDTTPNTLAIGDWLHYRFPIEQGV